MKKLVLSALCALGCAALFAADDSSLLYWMIGNNPAIYGGGSVSEYSVRVGVSGMPGYLNLYGEPGDFNYGTSIADASSAQWMGLYADISDYVDDPSAAIFVELYNEGGKYGGIARIGTVESLASYITAGSGMAGQVDPKVVSSFAMPEPTSGLLMLLGVAALSLRRKVKKA